MELEGLRVVAAILVVFFHASLMFYPAHFFGVGNQDAPVQNLWIEGVVYNSPVAGLLSGTFAVGIFFVLSGFVLSIGYFAKKDAGIVKRLAASRYLRLMIPALVSVLIAWACIASGLSAPIEGVIAASHSGWLGHTWNFEPNLFEALYQGMLGIFISQNVHYNPVLWTINVEFVGSFIVFATLLLFTDSKYRWIVYLALCILLAKTWLIGFVFGMILADIYINKEHIMTLFRQKWAYGIPVIAIILGGFPEVQAINPIYTILLMPGFEYAQNRSLIISMAAALLVFSVLVLPLLRRFFAHRYLSGLGRYTYSLYLIHLPVLLTFCATFFVFILPIGYHKAVLVSVLVTWIALLPVTYAYERFVDAPSIRLSKNVAAYYIHGEETGFMRYVRALVQIVRRITRI